MGLSQRAGLCSSPGGEGNIAALYSGYRDYYALIGKSARIPRVPTSNVAPMGWKSSNFLPMAENIAVAT
jgi:hypothetical protein